MSDSEARRLWREDHAIEAFKEQRDLDEDAELARYREVISVNNQRARDLDRRGEVRIRGTNPDEGVKHNPKHIRAQKDGKAPMHLLPWKPLAQVAQVLAGGANKYGERNWRIDEILASTYEGAIGRHAFLEWAQGVDADPDSGLHPLAHVAASCLIVLDAIDQGTFIDDRGRKETKDPEASS